MSLGIGTSSATTSSSGQKRKGDERLDGGSRLKRPKSDGSHFGATSVRIKEGELDAIGAYCTQETVCQTAGMSGNRIMPTVFKKAEPTV